MSAVGTTERPIDPERDLLESLNRAKLSIRGMTSFTLILKRGQGAAHVDKLLRGPKAILTYEGVYVRPDAVSHYRILKGKRG